MYQENDQPTMNNRSKYKCIFSGNSLSGFKLLLGERLDKTVALQQ